jgi:hypothetical protein
MRFYVDRLEGDLAAVQREDGVSGRILRKELPEGTREGSVLINEDGSWRLDEEKEKARRRAILRRLLKLTKRE